MAERLDWRGKAAAGYAAWLIKEHGATIDAEVKTIDIRPVWG